MKVQNKTIPLGKKPRIRMTRERKHRILVTLFYVCLILLCSLLQNTAHLFPTVFGAHAWLLIPLIICISMFDHNVVATVMAVLAGALWDVYSAWGDGFHALMLFLISTAVALLLNYVMRNNLVTCLLLGAIAVVLYGLCHWLIFVVFRGTGEVFRILVTFYLPTMLYTYVFTPLFYILIRATLVSIRNRYPKPVSTRRP
ncbi:MAG TPA: rod shape-determining protein MreD [Clostridiales bacterium]|nr:rod shape-determining protein MreD [Clostridiales bacterium]